MFLPIFESAMLPDFGGRSIDVSSTTSLCLLGKTSIYIDMGRRWPEVKLAETEGFEPSIRFKAYDDLANRCLQPLGHVSPNQRVGTL